jgi:LL-H family phage holin
MNFDLKTISELLQALVLAVLPVVAGYVALYLKKKTDAAYATLSAETKYALGLVVKTAVFAAEQIYGNGKGEAKKAYAIAVVQKWVDKSGLKIDVSLIEAEIEEAVFENFPNFPELPAE